VLDKDLFQCQADEIKDIHPCATMVAGDWVYER